MTIAIDLTSLSYHLTGIERYAMCVTDKLIDVDKTNEYILVFRNKIEPLFANRIDGKRIKAEILSGDNKLIFLQLILLRALRRINADKYVFFAFPSPVLFARKGIINTIHDMGAWDAADTMAFLSKYYFRISYRHAAKVSERIITVSRFSKNRIHLLLNVPLEKISVVYSAVYDKFTEKTAVPFEKVKQEYQLPDKYILTLSTLEPRKNMQILLEAFEAIAPKVDYDLVLVGRKGWKIDNVLNNYEARNRIHITGFVRDDCISSVYKNAICFVFPSRYEGFGLPPVEALALGVPVISSDAASLPEVLQEQAIYFMNDSVEELKTILVNLDKALFNMPHCLNQYQKDTYSFTNAATEIMRLFE